MASIDGSHSNKDSQLRLYIPRRRYSRKAKHTTIAANTSCEIAWRRTGVQLAPLKDNCRHADAPGISTLALSSFEDESTPPTDAAGSMQMLLVVRASN